VEFATISCLLFNSEKIAVSAFGSTEDIGSFNNPKVCIAIHDPDKRQTLPLTAKRDQAILQKAIQLLNPNHCVFFNKPFTASVTLVASL
jgi:hypothetical protein